MNCKMVCEGCGVMTDMGEFSEDGGGFLCALCLAEAESCGCSDTGEE